MPADIVAATGVAAMVIVSPETASIAILVLPLAAVPVSGIIHRLSVRRVSPVSFEQVLVPALLRPWLPPPPAPVQSADVVAGGTPQSSRHPPHRRAHPQRGRVYRERCPVQGKDSVESRYTPIHLPLFIQP